MCLLFHPELTVAPEEITRNPISIGDLSRKEGSPDRIMGTNTDDVQQDPGARNTQRIEATEWWAKALGRSKLSVM